MTLPLGWRELASRRPRVRWRLVRLLLCANRRVDPFVWWVPVEVWCSVFCHVAGTRLRCRLLLCANRRVDPFGWWIRVEVWCSVFCLVTGTRLRWSPPSRVARSRASSPCLVGIQAGVRRRPQPAPSSPLPRCCLLSVGRAEEGGGVEEGGGMGTARQEAVEAYILL